MQYTVMITFIDRTHAIDIHTHINIVTTYSRLIMSQGVSARVILAREELLMLKLFPNMVIVIFPDRGILPG